MFTIDELQRDIGVNAITLEQIADFLPWAKVFFIEAIGWFEPTAGGKQMGYTEALNYWSVIRNRFAARGLTIIATTHSPKAKGKDRYGHSRERVIGSTGHGAATATIINFDFEDECNATDMNRIMTISPRNYPNSVLRFKLDSYGRYVYQSVFEGEDKESEKGSYSFKKEILRMGSKPGDIFDQDSIAGIRERIDISRQTMTRIMTEMCEAGFFKRIKRGVFRLESKIERIVEQ
jgi:hypothetical protein